MCQTVLITYGESGPARALGAPAMSSRPPASPASSSRPWPLGPPTLFTIPVLGCMIFPVAPGEAGAQMSDEVLDAWVPACAGTTRSTSEQLAMISVVQREWAAKNRRVTFRDADHRQGCAQFADD